MGATDERNGPGPLTVLRTRDRLEAETVVEAAYLPNRLEPVDGRGLEGLDVRMDAIALISVTVGLVSFGVDARLVTADATHYHVNVPVSGRAVSRMGNGDPAGTERGQAAVFMPGYPADILWLDGCAQLCLMITRSAIENELEMTLGEPLQSPLRFEPVMDLGSPAGQGWRDLVDVFATELQGRPGLASHPVVGRNLERTMIDGLLLAQRHNYSDALARGRHGAPARPVARAKDLLEEQPEADWSMTRLARTVHASVRSLQAGFSRDVGVPPMTYLRQVRLRRAAEQLEWADPGSTTVAAVAANLGFSHLGRFAHAYFDCFGEYPSDTLRRS